MFPVRQKLFHAVFSSKITAPFFVNNGDPPTGSGCLHAPPDSRPLTKVFVVHEVL